MMGFKSVIHKNKFIEMCANPKVSFFSHIGVDKNGKTINPSRGHHLEIKPLREVLEYSNTRNKTEEKNRDGGIYFHQSNIVGKFDPSDAKGVFCEQNIDTIWNCCFIDIDGFDTNAEVDAVYSKFDEFVKYLPNLIAIQKSSSYYLGAGEHGIGLHLFFVIPDSYESEFKERAAYIDAAFSVVYEKIFGKEIKIDKVSRNPYSKLFIHYGDYLWNDKAYCVELSDSNKKELRKQYSEFFKGEDAQTKEVLVSPGVKVDINRNIVTSKEIYSYEDRWRLVETLRRVKDDFDFILNTLDTFCERRHSSNGAPFAGWEKEIRRIYNSRKPIYEGTYMNTLRELEEKGVLTVRPETEGNNYLAENEYAFDRKDDIVKFVRENTRSCVIAPTGSGKTTLINGFVKKEDEGTPFERDVLYKGIASELNAVVIVPYNSVNALYDNLYEVSTKKGNIKESIPEDKPVTIVIDQAIAHWDDIKGRQLIIDESHVLFADRSFRDRAAALLRKIKDDPDVKVCCVSATPLGEVDMLGCSVIEYRKVRSVVNLQIIDTDNVDYTLLDFARAAERERYYNKVVIFSDRYSRKLFENLIPIYGLENIAYIKSELKDSDDFLSLQRDEKVSKKVTIATRVAYNGLNFKNTDDRILVLTTFTPGETLPSEIIQSIGRFRNCKVNVKCILTPEGNKESISERGERAKFYDDTIKEEGLKKLFSTNYSSELLDQERKSVLEEIESYNKVHSTPSYLIDELKRIGYVYVTRKEVKKDIVKVKDVDEEGNPVEKEISLGSLRLKLKKAISEKFYKDVFTDDGKGIDRCFCGTDGLGKIYYTGLVRRWGSIEKVEGVDKELVRNLKNSSRRDILVDTVLSQIEDIIDVVSIPDSEWDKFMLSRDSYRMLASNVLPEDKYKAYVSREKKILSIRNSYKGKIGDASNRVADALDEFEVDSLFKADERKEKRRERFDLIPDDVKQSGRSKGGKIAGKISIDKLGKKIIDDEGNIFDSKNQLCLLKGIDKKTAKRRIDEGIYKEIDFVTN